MQLKQGRSIEFLLNGFPGQSPRAFLGWSNVLAIRNDQEIVIVDTGQAGDRPMLIAALAERHIDPAQINMVFITHFHFDHVNNIDLFPNAVLVMSASEWEYIQSGLFEEKHDFFVPKTFIPYLATRTMRLVSENDYIADGLKVVSLPGHTPGSAGLLLEEDRICIAGDALKNAHSFYFQDPGTCFDSRENGLASLGKIAQLAEKIIPGHDALFYQRNGEIVAESRQETISHYAAWNQREAIVVRLGK